MELTTSVWAGSNNVFAAAFVGPILEIKSGPTDYINLLEVSLNSAPNFLGTTALAFGLGVPAAQGIAAISAQMQPEDTGNNESFPGVSLITQWTRLPTVPTSYLRRATLNVGGGVNSVVLRFPRGRKMQPNTSLVLWLISTAVSFGNNLVILNGTVTVN